MTKNHKNQIGYTIRNFRLMADITQKELARRCNLNESTIRNYELGNRIPDEDALRKISVALNVSYYALSDLDIGNIFSSLHALFHLEWAYGLRPTMENGEMKLIFSDRLECSGPREPEELDFFRTIVTNWAIMRDKIDSGEITESEYWMKEITFPKPSRCRGFFQIDIEGNDAVAFDYKELDDEIYDDELDDDELIYYEDATPEQKLIAEIFGDTLPRKEKPKL